MPNPARQFGDWGLGASFGTQNLYYVINGQTIIKPQPPRPQSPAPASVPSPALAAETRRILEKVPDALSWVETKVVVPQSENSNVLLERRGGGLKHCQRHNGPEG